MGEEGKEQAAAEEGIAYRKKGVSSLGRGTVMIIGKGFGRDGICHGFIVGTKGVFPPPENWQKYGVLTQGAGVLRLGVLYTGDQFGHAL